MSTMTVSRAARDQAPLMDQLAKVSQRLVKATSLGCVVWGTDKMGADLTRALLRRTDMRPVAAIVTDPRKEGRDLGEICGLGHELGAPPGLYSMAQVPIAVQRGDWPSVIVA